MLNYNKEEIASNKDYRLNLNCTRKLNSHMFLCVKLDIVAITSYCVKCLNHCMLMYLCLLIK